MERVLVKGAAKILDVHENTIRDLERRGKLTAQRDYRGYRVFNYSQLIALKHERERLNGKRD